MNLRSKKNIQFKMDDFDEEQGIFSGYGAVFNNIDSGGDVIEPGAFTKSLAEGWERAKILALHNDGELPIGKPLELREDENGLFLKAKISDTSLGKDIKTLLRDGVLNELSIGYDAITYETDNDGVRHLTEVRLWEVSVVTWAMNPQATILDYKAQNKESQSNNEKAKGADGHKDRHAPIYFKQRKSEQIKIYY